MSVFFNAELNYHINKEICSVLKFHGSVSHNYYSFDSPAVTLVKGKLSSEDFEGCEA